jgi:leucyl aminopeptidase
MCPHCGGVTDERHACYDREVVGLATVVAAAALFLQEFTDGVPWLHMDVGDCATLEFDRDEWPVGPTGTPSRVILRYLENQARR